MHAWTQNWGAQLPGTITASAAQQPIQATWSQWRGSDGRQIWINVPEGMAQWCERLLFADMKQRSGADRHAGSSITRAAAQDGLQALLHNLASVGDAAPDLVSFAGEVKEISPVGCFTAGSGALTVIWQAMPGRPVVVVYSSLLPSGRVRAGEGALTSLKIALNAQHLRISVELGIAEMTLGQLESLHVGDVIRLDRCLTDALPILDEHGQQLFTGHPGKQRAARAIEVQK
ncbi:FliM/FliN family flagellar motor C-terminal domain-containing protein [Andreprevotia sp. IGB-42]|uniref:FliM/FliN family flagellar motor C-terminal domain-containing protein n=1 Tax=Andreprevotia sp. IGB-42 TaxID=2497473 RepID=UPI00135CA4F4|nr:FliM/FliN family flagellar motor C-terminal domain-containing protein [Andreprevotia sp. IGB-42]